MALYGSFAYSEELYGASTLDRPLFGLLADWDGDGTYDHGNMAEYLESLSITRGRQYFIRRDGKGFQKLDVGKLDGIFTNLDARWNVEDPASPYYPYIPPGKRMTLIVRTPSGLRVPLFTGTIQDIVPDSALAGRATISCEDGIRFLDQTASLDVMASVRVDEIVPSILAEINWPSAWGYDIDIGAEIKRYWWMDRENALNALHNLVTSELSALWLGGDGKLKVRSRYTAATEVASLSTSDFVLGSIETPRPWEMVRNSLRTNVYPPVLVTAVEVWRWGETVQIDAGDSLDVWASFTYNDVSVAVQNFVTPVATTDYLANSASDGSGTNLTSNISVSVGALFSGSAKLTIANSGASAAWITLLRTRADAITVPAETFVEFEDATSIERYQRRTFELTSRWFQDSDAAQSITDYLGMFLSAPKPYVRGVIVNDLDTQFGIDLGDMVYLSIPEKGIDGNYRLAWVNHKSTNRNLSVFRSTMLFEPYPNLSGDYWTIGTSRFGIETVFAP